MNTSNTPHPSALKTPPALHDPVARQGFINRWVWLTLAVIILLGAGLRLVNLSRCSFWIDELCLAGYAKDAENYWGIIKTEYERFYWMHRLPPPIMIIRASQDIFGHALPDETTARLPSALLGIFSIPLLFFLVRRMASPTAGLIAAGLLAFSVFGVYYSREGYDYSLVMTAALGILYALTRLWQERQDGKRPSPRTILLYLLTATLLLQVHLSGSIYLGCLLMVAGFILLWERWRQHAPWSGLLRILLILGAPCLTLLPLGLMLMQHPFLTTEMNKPDRWSWSVPIALLGRMGWGEVWWAVLPFALCVLGGLQVLWKKDRRLWLLLAGGTLLYAIVQSIGLRMARFEVRYYTPLFPLLLCVAALGLNGALTWLYDRLGKRAAAWAAVVGAVVLLGWLTPSLYAVTMLKMRGYMGYYKYCSAWLMEHLPDNGAYCFRSVYPLRGTPNTYPTPGRWGTFLVPTDQPAENRALDVTGRFASYFRRFPLTVFLDECPDLVKEMPTLPRSDWLMRTDWLEDNAWNLLHRLKTVPCGITSPPASDRLRICYNTKEDLPELMRRHGASWYHYHGPEWRPFKDQRSLLDGMMLQEAGTLGIGGLATNQHLNFVFSLAALGGNIKLAVIPPEGQGNAMIADLAAGQLSTVTIQLLKALPGESKLIFKVLNPDPGRRLLFIDLAETHDATAQTAPGTAKDGTRPDQSRPR